MLLALRAKLADGDPNWDVSRASYTEKTVFKIWSWIIQNRKVYDIFLRLAAFGQKFFPVNNGQIRWLPPPMNGWTQSRDVRPIAGKSFMQRWRAGQFD